MAKKKQPAKGRKQGAKGRGSADKVQLQHHPRAQRQIGLAKSYAGLGALALAAYSAWHGGAAFLDVASRALMWGIAAYLLVWALAVQVWRHLAVAEVRAAERRWRESRQPDEEQVRKLTRVLEDNGMPTTGTGATSPH
jgi:hypothetical protein